MSELDDAAAQRGDYLRALRAERAVLVARGLKDRVAQVDAQIRRLSSDAKPSPQTSRIKGAR